MKKLFVVLVFALLFILPLSKAWAFDINFWRHPEIAAQNSIFIDIGVPIYFENFEFNYFPLYIRVDYMLPASLPVSVGIFFHTPYPNLRSFGLRVGYHFDFRDPLLDVYVLWSFNCAFILTNILYQYGDAPEPFRFFDFRLGLRRFFGSWLGLSVETGFNLRSVTLSLSFKLGGIL